jgi:hypothetical protein
VHTDDIERVRLAPFGQLLRVERYSAAGGGDAFPATSNGHDRPLDGETYQVRHHRCRFGIYASNYAASR